ncbi:MAG TPA: hypothetical protein VIL99_00430 [Ignavibacteria bacterium]
MKEKIHRLSPELYNGEIYVAFTLCTYLKKNSLNNDEIFSEVEKFCYKN